MSFFSRPRPIATVAFNMRPRRSPYGGGNQWLLQMITTMKRAGYAVVFDLDDSVDCVMGTHAGLLGDLTFGYDAVAKWKAARPRRACIQRINDNDIRKGTSEMNALLAAANVAADHTVFVSAWLRDYHAARWFDAAHPHSVIHNGADPAEFHPIGNAVWRPGFPLRLATHHWSGNWMKGFKVYQEIDERIASGEIRDVELWIIGNWPSEIIWKSARTFGPCRGHKLAGLLRQCHAAITASLHEPGAMHPVESLQCGLPILYHTESGGTVELSEKFGVEFGEDVVAAVDALKERYAALRERVLIDAPSGDAMCLSYRRLIQSLIAKRSTH